jgi:sigma-B regulation protein RsbU (phosphoserine phosphatase)
MERAGARPRAETDTDEASALLQANADAFTDPQMLLEAVRDDSQEIVDFIYRAVNPATCENLGVPRDKLIGRSAAETLPHLEKSGLLSQYIACLDGDSRLVLDGYRFVLSADTRYCDIRANRVDPNLLAVTWRDVTERVVATEIADSEERFRLLADNLGDVVCRLTADGTILWASKSVEQLFGKPADFYIGRNMGDFISPADAEDYRDRLNTADRGALVVGRMRMLTPDGAVHWFHIFLKPFYDNLGRPDGLVVTGRNIDSEVAIEEQAHEAHDRWRRMMETAAVGMGISEPGGRFETVNRAMGEFFGYDDESLRQLTWQELTAPEFLETDLAVAAKLLSGELASYRTAKQFIHADGHRIWGDLSVSVLRSPNGDVERYIAQITDITAEVEARRLLTRREAQNRDLAARLQAQTDRLTRELHSAAAYVRSILPQDLDGPVRVTSRYLPSQELAGDCYGYRWIDEEHLAVYLVDVSGHGIQPALLSVSVLELLRSGSVPNHVLVQPDQVLAELNEMFSMERHADNYFTIWYGVYRPSTKTLTYCSGGHPPALLLSGGGDGVSITKLSTGGMPVGMFPDTEFTCAAVPLSPGDEVLICSDGAYEISLSDGQVWSLDEFTTLCGQLAATPGWTLDALLDDLRARTSAGIFEDDLSMVRLSLC